MDCGLLARIMHAVRLGELQDDDVPKPQKSKEKIVDAGEDSQDISRKMHVREQVVCRQRAELDRGMGRHGDACACDLAGSISETPPMGAADVNPLCDPLVKALAGQVGAPKPPLATVLGAVTSGVAD